MNNVLIVVVAAAGMAACSSSSGTDAGQDAGNPCQTSQTALDYGTCAGLADAGGGPILSKLTITPQQRAACEVACSSSSDQAAVTSAFKCLNAISADAGPCVSGSESTWGTLIASKAIVCENALNDAGSAACYTAVLTPPDAG